MGKSWKNGDRNGAVWVHNITFPYSNIYEVKDFLVSFKSCKLVQFSSGIYKDPMKKNHVKSRYRLDIIYYLRIYLVYLIVTYFITTYLVVHTEHI